MIAMTTTSSTSVKPLCLFLSMTVPPIPVFFLSFPAAGSVRCLFQRFAPIAPLIVRA